MFFSRAFEFIGFYAVNSTHMPLIFLGDSDISSLSSPEVEATTLNRKKARIFTKNYGSTFGQDPSDAEIRDIFSAGLSLLVGVNWLKPSDIF